MAYCYADSILNDLSCMRTWPRGGATGLGLDFPLLVAMLEIPDRGEEMFRDLDKLRFRQHSKESLEFVRSVRTAYESGYGGLWFDLVSEHLEVPILP